MRMGRKIDVTLRLWKADPQLYDDRTDDYRAVFDIDTGKIDIVEDDPLDDYDEDSTVMIMPSGTQVPVDYNEEENNYRVREDNQ